jgi:hypothetical protein
MMTMRANSFAAVKTLCILIAHLTLRQLIAVRRPVMENNSAYYTILLASLGRSLSNNQSDYEGCCFTCQVYVTEIFMSEAPKTPRVLLQAYFFVEFFRNKIFGTGSCKMDRQRMCSLNGFFYCKAPEIVRVTAKYFSFDQWIFT